MCVRTSKTPKEKKEMVTNKLYGEGEPELLSEARGMDAIEELVFLNRSYRRMSSDNALLKLQISLMEKRMGESRESLWTLRDKCRLMDWTPQVQQVIEYIEKELDI